MIKEILNFIKNNFINIFFILIIYQLVLCVITFSAKNFQVLLIEIIIMGGFILYENIKNKQ